MKKTALLFIGILVFSCGKRRNITGRIYNPITNESYGGIEVEVIRDKKPCLSYDGCGARVVKSTTTNANGEFSLSFYRKPSDQLVVNYDPKVYFSEKGAQIFEDITNIDYPIFPLGKRQMKIVNTNCFDENDELLINERYHRSLPNLIHFTAGANFAIYPGCMDQIYSNSAVPMGWWVWKGTVTKNNVTTPFADSIYVPAGGSVLWTIEY